MFWAYGLWIFWIFWIFWKLKKMKKSKKIQKKTKKNHISHLSCLWKIGITRAYVFVKSVRLERKNIDDIKDLGERQ